ncbi:hypothetical protein KEJ36_05215, partial [Candidatus Bathyarchaeota archaeon]|nr:hypothetical protein [Candidatus Bathyarchaeota archaeon]
MKRSEVIFIETLRIQFFLKNLFSYSLIKAVRNFPSLFISKVQGLEDPAMKKVRLGGWIELSAIDWPGNLTFMLFLSGCNLACP